MFKRLVLLLGLLATVAPFQEAFCPEWDGFPVPEEERAEDTLPHDPECSAPCDDIVYGTGFEDHVFRVSEIPYFSDDEDELSDYDLHSQTSLPSRPYTPSIADDDDSSGPGNTFESFDSSAAPKVYSHITPDGTFVASSNKRPRCCKNFHGPKCSTFDHNSKSDQPCYRGLSCDNLGCKRANTFLVKKAADSDDEIRQKFASTKMRSVMPPALCCHFSTNGVCVKQNCPLLHIGPQQQNFPTAYPCSNKNCTNDRHRKVIQFCQNFWTDKTDCSLGTSRRRHSCSFLHESDLHAPFGSTNLNNGPRTPEIEEKRILLDYLAGKLGIQFHSPATQPPVAAPSALVPTLALATNPVTGLPLVNPLTGLPIPLATVVDSETGQMYLVMPNS